MPPFVLNVEMLLPMIRQVCRACAICRIIRPLIEFGFYRFTLYDKTITFEYSPPYRPTTFNLLAKNNDE